MADKKLAPAELKAAASADSPAKARLSYLFDGGSFTELDAYTVNGDKLCGAVTAFGYIDEAPCYAFSQDSSVNKGALNKAQADKIARLYELAAKTGVPVVGFYDSCGADLTDGGILTAYGELLLHISNLSGVVPQISVVSGVCSGTAALLAEGADITLITKKGELYASPNADIKLSYENAAENGAAAIVCEDDEAAAKTVRELLSKLPDNNLSTAMVFESAEPVSAFGEDAASQAAAIFDEGSITELSAGYGKASYTALALLDGVSVGVAATNKTADKLTADDCNKLARFVRFCDSFALPVITLADTEGFEGGTESEEAGSVKNMAKLSHAYSEATTVKLSVVTGKACGAAFITLAGKGANADLSFACENAVIAPLDPMTAAEFLYHDELKGAKDLAAERKSLAAKYAAEEGNAALAASNGSVDGVIGVGELRKTLIAALGITAGKRVSRLPKKHSNIQL